MYSQELKVKSWGDILSNCIHGNIIHNSQQVEATKMFTSG
jgi:hypothetical protein